MSDHVHVVATESDVSSIPNFIHADGQVCVPCQGCFGWLRAFEGIDGDAVCMLEHDHSGGDVVATGFTTLDSGERVDFPSGMRRDTDKGKPRYDLIPRPMLKRLAELYARGAEKYGDDNWTLADSQAEVDRFQASAFRHFMQYLNGERDEDHMAATVFNLFASETIADKVRGQ